MTVVRLIPRGNCQCGCGEKTPLSRRTVTASGIRMGEPLRFAPRHQNRVNARALRKSVRWREQPGPLDTPCQIWLLASTNGYGFDSAGKGRKRLAHCLAWEREHGPIPIGYEIHHLCRNPKCVAVDHLCLLTQLEHAAEHRTVDRDEIRRARVAGERRKDTLKRLGISASSYYRAVSEAA
jgi:HNH endonuclease